MKRMAVLLLAVSILMTGCTIVIVDPFATAPTQESVSDLLSSGKPTEPTSITEEPAETKKPPATQPVQTAPRIGGICGTCGLPYAEGAGMEGLCFICQEKYGPKCIVCGIDCTYRETVSEMCMDCYNRRCAYCACSGFAAYQMRGNLCYNCSAEDIPCAQCGKQCDYGGMWANGYFCCEVCGVPKPCAKCGVAYYIWDMFEGVCPLCEDPSGGEAGGWDGMCIQCGGAPGDYDGYCYYCHPNFGFTCSKCGYEQPYHKTESGLCYSCEAGDIMCAHCGTTLPAVQAIDGLCWTCYSKTNE